MLEGSHLSYFVRHNENTTLLVGSIRSVRESFRIYLDQQQNQVTEAKKEECDACIHSSEATRFSPWMLPSVYCHKIVAKA